MELEDDIKAKRQESDYKMRGQAQSQPMICVSFYLRLAADQLDVYIHFGYCIFTGLLRHSILLLTLRFPVDGVICILEAYVTSLIRGACHRNCF